jgi:hypothetical protein
LVCRTHTPRVVIRGRPAPCAELARCGRRRPRVTIVVQTLWPATSSCRYRGANPSSCRYRWLNPGGNSRWQPGGCVNIHTVKIRVPAVVQTRGESNVSQPLLESLSWCQPRGVTTRVVIRGRRRTRTRCSCGVCCGVQPRGVTTRVATRGRPAACSELACCGRPPPRVAIVVPTPPRVTVVVPTPPRVAIVVPTPWCNDSRCNSRTHASEQFQYDER